MTAVGGEHVADIAARCSPIRLALIPIGAYFHDGLWPPMHLSPSEAFEAHQLLRANTNVAIHFGTFALGDDGQTEAADELEALKRRTQDDVRFWSGLLKFGEGRDVPKLF